MNPSSIRPHLFHKNIHTRLMHFNARTPPDEAANNNIDAAWSWMPAAGWLGSLADNFKYLRTYK